MRIGVIGAGNVGGTLGRRWAEKGHTVTFGLRDPAAGAGANGEVPAGSRVATIREAAAAADVVVLATPWGAVRDALASAGDLTGKILVDAVNPLRRAAGGMEVDEGPDHQSGAERVAALAPGARVVKAFNTTGFNNMADPVYGGEPTVMFVAGDDPAAKQSVRELASDLGFDAIDAGPLVRARELEHLALLWISLASGGMGRDIAFRLVRR